MRRRRGQAPVAALALAAVLATGGCGSEGDAGSGSGKGSAMEPSATPSPPVTPSAHRRGDRVVNGSGFSLWVAPAFQQETNTASNGEPVLVLSRPSGVPQVHVGVSVFRDPDPKTDVAQQSYALEMAKRTIAHATDISRARVDWPGATDTVLVQWTQQLATTGGATVPVRYWQLNAQVSPGLILIVVGFAPVSAFDTSGVAEAVSSFRPGGS